MTKTPLTDEQEFDRFPDDPEADTRMVVDSDFARELETKLQQAEQRIKELEHLAGGK